MLASLRSNVISLLHGEEGGGIGGKLLPSILKKPDSKETLRHFMKLDFTDIFE